MKKLYNAAFLLSALLLGIADVNAQSLDGGNLHGNFSADVNYYRKDTAIKTPAISDKIGMMSYGNLIYTNGSFSAGVRYENYTNAVLRGLNEKWNGMGIPYRYASYTSDGLEVTIGNFYDQFGNGLIFRCYEEKTLGIDNTMDGFRVKIKPLKGLYVKGIYGKQRNYFSYGEGIVRGGDVELQLNEALPALSSMKTHITLGASGVSKYQKDNDPIFRLPENVAAGAGRIIINRGGFNINAEYAYKANDPSPDNGYLYKPGNAFMMSAGYSQKGFGAVLSAKRLDNMFFRSERSASGTELNINFLPPISKLQTYQLATLYPFATNANSEVGYQGEVYYFFKPGTLLGGTYGTNVSLNASIVKDIDTTRLSDPRKGYTSNPFLPGKQTYYRDFNLEINKKFTKDLKGTFTYINMMHDIAIVPRPSGFIGPVNANIGIIDLTYKLKPTRSIRGELQGMFTKDDQGSWAQALLEYTMSGWIFTVYDMYNYGNAVTKEQLHYYNGAVAYVNGATRISVAYGRQRAGLLCVGGVCRQVPASNGLSLSITTSF